MKKSHYMPFFLISAVMINLLLIEPAWTDPGSEHLSQTMECQFTPELTSLAETLSHDPIRIYNWVYENIEYEEYSSSRKGAQATYFSRRGNPWDQCSLLITLLRISGIPAQYVYYDSYWGVAAEAWLPVDNYRGTGSSTVKNWIPLAPWKKEFRVQEGINLFPDQTVPAELDFDFIDYMSTVKQTTALELFEQKVQDYLNTNYPGKTLKDIPYKETLIKHPSSVLPGGLPSGVVSASEKDVFAEIPNEHRENITLYFKQYDTDVILLQRTIYMPEIAGKRFCLDFTPASDSDAQIISSYGGICLTPENEAQIKPVLKIDGDVIAEGAAIATGQLYYPAYEGGGHSYTSRPSKVAGGILQMGLDPLSASESEIEKLKTELESIPQSATLSDDSKETYIGRVGDILIKTFLNRKYDCVNQVNRLFYLKHYWGGLFPTFIQVFPKNLPTSDDAKYLIYPQWDIDTRSLPGWVFQADDQNRNYLYISSSPYLALRRDLYMHDASYNEGLIFEDWQDTPGLSTVKMIMIANETGVPVVTLTADDISDGHVYILEDQTTDRLPDHIIANVISELESGQAITMPVRTILYEGVNAYAYKSIGPLGAGYIFNGQLGGTNSETIAENNTIADASSQSSSEQEQQDEVTLNTSDGEAIIENSSSLEVTTTVNSWLSAIGDPVDMASGEYYQDELPDLTIPSRGYELSIKRTYKSGLIYKGPFGFGWAWNHGEKLVVMDNGDLTYYDNSLKSYYLVNNGDGTYEYPDGSTFTIIKESDNSYEVTLKSRHKIIFDADRRLVQKEDPNGNTLIFEYNADNRLSAIKDALNRSLTLSYNDDGKVIQVTDFLGRHCDYVYDSLDLISFTDLEGNTTQYEYLKDQENPLNDHNMSKSILPNGDYLEIGYYKNDQVAYHRNKKGEVFNFQYSRLNRYGETWNEAGYYRKVFFNERNDEIRVDNEDKTISTKTWDDNHNKLSETDANGNTTTFTWDDNRNMLTRTNALGHTWQYEYNLTWNKAIRIIDPMGGETNLAYDETGNLISRTDALNQTTTFAYDDFGNLIQTTDPLLNSVTVQFDSDHLYPVARTDENGNITEFEYTQAGQLITEIDPAGFTIRKSYNAYGLPVTVTDPLGNDTEMIYNENRQQTHLILANGAIEQNIFDTARDIVSGAKVIEKRDPLGFSQHFEYDAVGNMIKRTEKNGNLYRFDYDGMNRLIEHQDPFQNSEIYTYDGKGNRTSQTDRRGNQTRFEYDAAGRKISMTDALENIFEYEYDANNNLVREILPTSSINFYEYDSLNRLISKTESYGSTIAAATEFEYDAKNRRTRIIYASGAYEQMVYDNAGNKIRQSYFAPDHTKLKEVVFVYDSRSLLVEKITDNGYEDSGEGTAYEYDGLRRLIAETDPAGNRTAYAYDEVGNRISVTDPLGSVTRFEYDLAGQLVKTVDAENKTVVYRYDPNGNQISVRDREGNETLTYYDARNLKIGIEDPMEGLTTFDYDENGNPVAISDPNQGTTSYDHDAANRLISLARPLGQATQMAYDSVGNLTARYNARGQKISYTYDLRNRRTGQQHFADSTTSDPIKTIAFTYDVMANLTGYDDGTSSGIYTYDAMNRKTGESVDFGSFSKSIAYGYPSHWQRTYTGPDNVTITYDYDATRRLKQISIPGQGNIQYQTYEWKQPTQITYPSGSTADLTYDALRRMASLSMKNSALSVQMSRSFQYSAAGNIEVKETEHGTYSYSYDKNHRLLTAANPGADDETYTYDALGNRLSSSGTGSWQYSKNNELLSFGTTTCSYDDDGNILARMVDGVTVQSFTHDPENRMTQVADGTGAVIADYVYDPFGRRISKTVDGVRTFYLYWDEGLVAEFDDAGNQTAGYGYILDTDAGTVPVFYEENGSYYWFYNDHLGTPQQLSDSSGTIVWEARYDSFGNADIITETVTCNLRFPGQYWDAETGLHYNWHRYYDPSVGRYLGADPLGLEVGLNLYVYALNNPLKYTDPDGLMARAAYNATKDFVWDTPVEYWNNKVDNAVTWHNSLGNYYPDAKIVSGTGNIGILATLTYGADILINSESGEFSVFAKGGFEGGSTAFGGSVSAGAIWNLEENAKYEGPSLAVTAGTPIDFVSVSGLVSSDEILTTKISEDPYYGGTINIGVSLMPLPTAAIESSTSKEIITIPYLGYLLDPIGTIMNKIDQ